MRMARYNLVIFFAVIVKFPELGTGGLEGNQTYLKIY